MSNLVHVELILIINISKVFTILCSTLPVYEQGKTLVTFKMKQ